MLNEEGNIGRCLDSILASSIGYNYELLLLNNGSSDGTGNILLNYKDVKNCSIISFEHTVGLNVARNFLLNKSNGRVAVFLDADGVVSSNYFSRLVQSLSPDVSIYSGPVPEQAVDQNIFFELHYRSLMRSDPRFLIGANFAVDVAAAREVGGFPDITVRRGDESPLVALMLKNGARHLFVDDLIASNHFITSSEDFIRSFYYEGQNAYLCMLYFDEPFFAKSVYKAMFVSSLLLCLVGLLMLNVDLILIGMGLMFTKLLWQYKYWTELLGHFLTIASLSSAKGLAVTLIAHITHELGYWHSMLTRKKPNCWKG